MAAAPELRFEKKPPPQAPWYAANVQVHALLTDTRREIAARDSARIVVDSYAPCRMERMQIKIMSAVGTGPTALGAFDAALRNSGVENYNLIPLSSVIPTRAVVERSRFSTPPGEYGHRLYVVMARHETSNVGEEAWAGLGWTQEPESGRGLFVELHSTSRRSVETDIDSTLDSMKEARPYDYGKNEAEITGVTCEGDPVCALVIAVYASEPWGA